MISLAAQLFREVRPGFFRVLAGGNAAVYLDVLDALERESSERHEGMSREEALAIVREVLSAHPGCAPDEPEATATAMEADIGYLFFQCHRQSIHERVCHYKTT